MLRRASKRWKRWSKVFTFKAGEGGVDSATAEDSPLAGDGETEKKDETSYLLTDSETNQLQVVEGLCQVLR
jgi:hypothetical protein